MSKNRLLKKERPKRRPHIPYLKFSFIFFFPLGLFLFWLWWGGWFERFEKKVEYTIQKKSIAWGLTVQNVSISGLKKLKKKDILKRLPFSLGGSFLKTDLEESYHALSEIPWIKSLRIERFWPHTIKIFIEEKHPLCIWQFKKIFYLIDMDGDVINVDNIGSYMDLPLVLGEGAPKKAQSVIQILEKLNFLKSIKAISRIANRRWNLLTNTGLTILLPEKNIEDSLLYLLKLEKSYQILKRAKHQIDLRLHDKLIFE